MRSVFGCLVLHDGLGIDVRGEVFDRLINLSLTSYSWPVWRPQGSQSRFRNRIQRLRESHTAREPLLLTSQYLSITIPRNKRLASILSSSEAPVMVRRSLNPLPPCTSGLPRSLLGGLGSAHRLSWPLGYLDHSVMDPKPLGRLSHKGQIIASRLLRAARHVQE